MTSSEAYIMAQRIAFVIGGTWWVLPVDASHGAGVWHVIVSPLAMSVRHIATRTLTSVAACEAYLAALATK